MKTDEKFNLNYRKLKQFIKESCKDDPNEPLKFSVNFQKLANLIDNADLGIVLIANGAKSKYINQDTIVLLSHVYTGDRLQWFDSHKQYTSLTFIRKDAIDKRAKELMNELRNLREGEKIAIDRVKALSELIAVYPCFIVTIVAYSGNDPETIGRNSYTINVKSNFVQRNDEKYSYNPEDVPTI